MTVRHYTDYGSSGMGITITLASLATGNARESTAISNVQGGTTMYLDVLVQLKVKTQAGTAGSDKKVYVYAAGSVDGGTTWPDAVTGVDAAITLNSPTNLALIGVIECPAQSTTYKSKPMSVAAAFGGVMPERWSIVVENKTNISLSATETDMDKRWQGVWAQSV